MIPVWSRLQDAVEADGISALVSVVAVSGSAPRDAGAYMVLRSDGGFWGTVGGGELEWRLMAEARDMISAGQSVARRRDWPLGPDLGQCCGGRVATVVEVFTRQDLVSLRGLAAREVVETFTLQARIGPDGRVHREPATDVVPAGGWLESFGDSSSALFLFGAGHVGRALVLALAPLPLRVVWIDPRREAFPSHMPANVSAIHSPDPPSELAADLVGADVMVMTHSHPLDLAIVEAALRRPDLGHVGLIGSATKRARFMTRLRAASLGEAAAQRLVCPIGVPGIAGKEPAVIAASVAAQLLQWQNEAMVRRPRPAPSLRLAGARR
jgi:xanthine dehydrogenase accessory factor